MLIEIIVQNMKGLSDKLSKHLNQWTCKLQCIIRNFFIHFKKKSVWNCIRNNIRCMKSCINHVQWHEFYFILFFFFPISLLWKMCGRKNAQWCKKPKPQLKPCCHLWKDMGLRVWQIRNILIHYRFYQCNQTLNISSLPSLK